MKKKEETKATETRISIAPPNMVKMVFSITGLAQLVQNRFAAKAIAQIIAKQEQGDVKKVKALREPKDFQRCYEEALHVSREGWYGIPCAAFRNAMIRACTLVGLPMTMAKMTVFVFADGYDRVDGSPLVKITYGEPHMEKHTVRPNRGGIDIRPRPVWEPGWKATVRVEFDADQFTQEDVANLLERAGRQVGICEGRPSSPKSNGMGWGLFTTRDVEARKETAA